MGVQKIQYQYINATTIWTVVINSECDSESFFFWPLKIDFNQEWINESKKKNNRKQKIMKYKNVK